MLFDAVSPLRLVEPCLRWGSAFFLFLFLLDTTEYLPARTIYLVHSRYESLIYQLSY